MKDQIVQFKSNIIIIFTILLSFIVDRITKILAINFFLSNNIDSFYFNSFLNFILIWNRGIAFGLLESENFIYHLITFFIFLILFCLFFLLLKSKFLFEKFFYALIIGGAFGNFFDRLYYGAVPDFIDIHYKNFHWFTFNISDMLITIGILGLLILDTFKYKNKNNE